MKKITAILIVLGFAVASLAGDAYAVPDKTVSVSATGSVAGSTSLSVTPASIAYGTATTDMYPTTPVDKKVVISYSSNYNPWKIAIYNNNTQVPNYPTLDPDGNHIGRYQKGGLATAPAASGLVNVTPCKWVAKAGTNPTLPVVPQPPAVLNGPTNNFVKDKRDQNDLATPGDESWAASFASGYCNIAYGGQGFAYCVDPFTANFQGDLITPASGIAVYIGSLFGTSGGGTYAGFDAVPAPAGSYTTTFYFDLYHE